MRAIGWQGGTVHELCLLLGLDVHEFLTEKPTRTWCGTNYDRGLYWHTNSKEHQQKSLIPAYSGVLDYWLGVARAQHLKEIEESVK